MADSVSQQIEQYKHDITQLKDHIAKLRVSARSPTNTTVCSSPFFLLRVRRDRRRAHARLPDQRRPRGQRGVPLFLHVSPPTLFNSSQRVHERRRAIPSPRRPVWSSVKRATAGSRFGPRTSRSSHFCRTCPAPRLPHCPLS
jgi:hypothetical protein